MDLTNRLQDLFVELVQYQSDNWGDTLDSQETSFNKALNGLILLSLSGYGNNQQLDQIRLHARFMLLGGPLAFRRWPMSQWHDFRAVKNDLCEKCSEYQWDVRMNHGAGSSTLAQAQTEDAANLIVEALNTLRKTQMEANL